MAEKESHPQEAAFPESPPGIIRNCTPHDLVLYAPNSEKVLATWEKSTTPIRVAESITKLPNIIVAEKSSLPLFQINTDNKRTQLPEPESGVLFVVSRVTAMQYPKRRDFIFPFQEVRDETGRIIGCRGFGSFASLTSEQ